MKVSYVLFDLELRVFLELYMLIIVDLQVAKVHVPIFFRNPVTPKAFDRSTK